MAPWWLFNRKSITHFTAELIKNNDTYFDEKFVQSIKIDQIFRFTSNNDIKLLSPRDRDQLMDIQHLFWIDKKHIKT